MQKDGATNSDGAESFLQNDLGSQPSLEDLCRSHLVMVTTCLIASHSFALKCTNLLLRECILISSNESGSQGI